MQSKWIEFFKGRYGMDQFSKFLLLWSVILTLISGMSGFRIMYSIGMILFVFGMYRVFSKHINRRYEENMWFLQKYGRAEGWFRKKWNLFRLLKKYRIYRCPQCRQKIRIPKGKGKVEIHCPICKTDFIRRR